ncbi:glycosyltransferase [Arthrobacter sp. 08Y14]|uniref:glycosyltransferase n=1 Tax=Arthrobacter sp. 08Y14 TaxID=2058885 RepID=UPI0011B04A15|nr:glycosyltransferase [Arthrobacter sp. 08Y14]
MKSNKKRAVLVASTGGHLAQLHRLAPKLDISADPLWVTFENEQSKSLLRREKNVMFLPYIASRDWRTALRSVGPLQTEFRKGHYDMVFSTGAALAVPAFIAASTTAGMRRYYLESVSRFDGPSLSGRIVSAIPGTQVYTQHAEWSSKKWKQGPCVLDDYTLISNEIFVPKNRRLKIFVTLGTIRPYRFDRAVDAIVKQFGEHDIVWQLGVTNRGDLPGYATAMMDAFQFDSQVERADVVITHAGVGSAMRIMDLGKTPIMVTRSKDHGEHVDNHQNQITRELTRRGLAFEMNLMGPNPGLLEASMAQRPKAV